MLHHIRVFQIGNAGGVDLVARDPPRLLNDSLNDPIFPYAAPLGICVPIGTSLSATSQAMGPGRNRERAATRSPRLKMRGSIAVTSPTMSAARTFPRFTWNLVRLDFDLDLTANGKDIRIRIPVFAGIEVSLVL